MIRLGPALAALAVCTAAAAQPAPHTEMEAVLPAAEGFTLNRFAATGRLAVGRDGVNYVLLHEFVAGAESAAPARDARIEILAVAASGHELRRKTLPWRHGLSTEGFALDSLGVIVARSGDLAVLASGYRAAPSDAARPAGATLFHLGADLSLKKATRLAPPDAVHWRDDRDSFYGVTAYQPTADNGVMLGGGFGPGPLAWWMGKFNLDGVRLWQAGPGRHVPERVAAIGQRPGGAYLALVAETRPGGGPSEWALRRYARDGRLLARIRLPQPTDATMAMLPDGPLLAVSGNQPTRRGELVFLDDGGKVRRRAPWPFAQTRALIACGDGFAALVTDTADGDGPASVVRADPRGTVRWRTDPILTDEIAATPDGQIAVLARNGQSGSSLRLIRYRDP